MKESAIQSHIIHFLNAALPQHGVVMSIPNEGKRDPRTGARMKRQGLFTGAADLMILVDGKAMFLEVKTPTGRQTVHQERFERTVNHAGCPYAVVRSVGDVEATLISWDVPLRARASA